jgi:hypothetical protein
MSCPITPFITKLLYLVKIQNRLAQIKQFTCRACFKYRLKKILRIIMKGNENGIVIQGVAC